MFEMLVDGLPPVPTLTRHQQVDPVKAIVARERLIARLQAEQAEQVKAMADQHTPVCGTRGVAAEVALARGVSPMAAEHQLHVAQRLVDSLPEMFELLHRGEISFAAASAVVRETGVVSVQVRREIDRRLAAVVAKSAARRIAIGDHDGPDGGPDDLAGGRCGGRHHSRRERAGDDRRGGARGPPADRAARGPSAASDLRPAGRGRPPVGAPSRC